MSKLLNGFRVTIGKGREYMLIENVDKTGSITIIESNGNRYDLTENQFIMFADKLKSEADKLREKIKKEEPKTKISFDVEPPKEETKPKKAAKKGKGK